MNKALSLRLFAYISLLVPIGAAACADGAPATLGTTNPSITVNGQSPEEQNAKQEAIAYDILTNTCQACHDLGMLVRRPIAATEWTGILDKMVGLGANLTTDDRKILQSYLTKTYSSSPQAQAAGNHE